ncbi:MAG: hypothetical protein JW864_12300 [Spirochaetes bacterium]|nr:hypothetical protein [Spirochaetota bacterium]
MKCKNAIQSFLDSEDSCYIPFPARLHMVFCKSCRNEINTMRNIFNNAKYQPTPEIPVDMAGIIMDKISDSNIAFEKHISFYRWLFAGLVISASMFLIPYSDSFAWLKQHFGSGLEIPVNIVLGLVVTSYAASFIGTHIDEAKKIIKIISDKIH